MNENVIVTSMVNATVGLTVPHLFLKRIWPKKGAKLPIDKEVLRQAFYEPGVEAMFREGILYIDDMDFKIELGLEAPGATVPTDLIPVDEKYLNRVLKLMPVAEMKRAIRQMSENQLEDLINYAAEQNDLQMERINAIKDVTGTDLFKVIELKRQKGE